MPRRSCLLAALCLIAVSGSFCLVAAPSAFAKHKSSVAVKKHKSVAATKKRKPYATKKQRLSVTEEPVSIPQSRTPVDKHDCIATAQAFYVQAGTVSRRTKQAIPREFERVISKLDEFCGEEEFEKARVSIDWMSTCLQSLTRRDHKEGQCSTNGSYFCAIDPQSEACISSEGRAER